MFGFVARLIGGAVQPLFDRLAAAGASIARKIVLFAVAAASFLVVVLALTIAFDLWIASLAGPIVAALAVAGHYLAIGVICVALALRPAAGPGYATAAEEETARHAEAAQTARSADIDAFIAPLLALLSQIGLKREQFAVLTGASLAKQLRPVPLVMLAIVAGFLIGRFWKGWEALRAGDWSSALFGLFNGGQGESQQAPEASPDLT